MEQDFKAYCETEEYRICFCVCDPFFPEPQQEEKGNKQAKIRACL